MMPWYTPEWFTPSTLGAFAWANGYFIYGVIAMPVVFIIRWLIRYFSAQRLHVALPQKEIKTSPLNWILIAIPEVLLMLAGMLFFVAMARPQKTNEKVEQFTEGIDIMLALDISQSMMIEDFKPNRLEAAKKVATKFIEGRVQDRIGLVVFSGDAFSLAPLTTDYELLKSYIREINFEIIENKGTAIGSALAVATNRMRESTTKSKVCILLSDGENTAGNIDPITAAKLGAAYDIKIYTIVVGKEGLVPYGKDFFGRPQMIENTIDETTMRRIAKIGNGEFYRVTNNKALSEVFQRIDKYEKAEIKETRFKDTTDYYFIYLSWGTLLFLCWLFTKSTFLTNVLQD